MGFFWCKANKPCCSDKKYFKAGDRDRNRKEEVGNHNPGRYRIATSIEVNSRALMATSLSINFVTGHGYSLKV